MFSKMCSKKCDHSKVIGRQKLVHSVFSKIKDNIKCGFVINYACIKHKRPLIKNIYYRVHLTSFNFEHNHELSNVLKKKVSDSSRKTSSSDVKVLNSVLAVLKYNPKHESTELRNMIRNVVPHSTKIDA